MKSLNFQILFLAICMALITSCGSSTNDEPIPTPTPVEPTPTPVPNPDLPPGPTPDHPSNPQGKRIYEHKYIGQLPVVPEKSGLCQGGDGRFYLIPDSGNGTRNYVAVIDRTGKHLQTIILKDVVNQDFEAVACGDGKVFVGDIGDSGSKRTIYSFPFPEPGKTSVTVVPHWERFSSDLNFEGMAWHPVLKKLILANKDWGAEQALYEYANGVIKKILVLPPKIVDNALGELSINWNGSKFLITKDDSNVFWECDWQLNCEKIESAFNGDHEATAYVDDHTFIYTTEDDNELWQTSWTYESETEPTPNPEPTPTPEPTPDPGPTDPVSWYKPAPMTRFQVLDSDDGAWDVQAKKKNAQIIVVEGIPGTDDGTCKEGYARIASQIQKLKALGKRVSCYQSLSYEEWRCDHENFPASAKGKKMSGWDELWTDVRVTSKGHKFWDNRYEQLAKIGCDCIEDDNEVDPNDNETGFPLTRPDVEKYSSYRAGVAQKLGVCHIAKNNPSVSDIKSKFSDGVMIEEAYKYNERAPYLPWKAAGKWGAMVEYSSSGCKPYAGFAVQYHPNGDYFDGLNFQECDALAKAIAEVSAEMASFAAPPLQQVNSRGRHGRSPTRALEYVLIK